MRIPLSKLSLVGHSISGEPRYLSTKRLLEYLAIIRKKIKQKNVSGHSPDPFSTIASPLYDREVNFSV